MKYINPVNYRQNIFSGSPLRDIEKELNVLFGQLPTWGSSKVFEDAARQYPKNLSWYDSEEAFVAQFDLPGVKASDVSLEIEKGVLSLEAKRKSADSSIRLSVKVPEDVAEEDISAALEDGVLRLTFPKQAKAKARRVEVRDAN
ncbi:Hsp20/alpha crystallin family protein [Puniceicoccaceae bacterium K14]|nr:Hsp20/alpha crystallin family protein [Puniceicoccaceae bacterium K14]